MAKIRKQIYLDKKHDQQLKRLAEARGVSEAEVIRQAIEHEAAAAGPLPRRLEAFNEFKKAALERRKLGITGEPYKWNRDEIYAERMDRFNRTEK
jgi:hypothetical protein